MPNLDVEPETLRAAARASRELAAGVRAVDPGAADGVRAAMEGSAAAGHAAGVGSHWTDGLTGLQEDLEARADGLDAAAEVYDGGERATVAEVDGVRATVAQTRVVRPL